MKLTETSAPVPDLPRRRWLRQQCAGGLGLLGLPGLGLASPNVPPPPQREPLLIVNAHLHPVSGPPLQQGRMWIENGLIRAIGGADLAVPAGMRSLDLQGRRLYPGLISANTAIGLVEVSAVRATVDSSEVGALNPNARALVAVNADSELIPVSRAGGVLTALAVPEAPPGTGLIAGTSALLQLDGWNWREMSLVDELALHISLPSWRAGRGPLPADADKQDRQGQQDLRRSTQTRLRLLEDSFEAARAYAQARAADPGLAQDVRWEAMRAIWPAGSGGNQPLQRPVFIRADELGQIRWALDFAQRFSLRLVLLGGADAWRLADTLREREVPVVIAGLHRLPLRRDDAPDALFSLPARLAAAGVRFCIARAGGGASANERNLAFEAAQATAYGLSSEEALKAITLYPAQILGVADRLGSLQPGKLASFFVSSGDPLDLRSQIERVFIRGREIELSDRQTRLRDKYLQR